MHILCTELQMWYKLREFVQLSGYSIFADQLVYSQEFYMLVTVRGKGLTIISLTRFNSCYSFSNTFNYPSSLMTKNTRKLPLWVHPTEGITVCVADTCPKDLDAHFTSFRWCNLYCLYCKRFASLPSYCGTARNGLSKESQEASPIVYNSEIICTTKEL